MTIAVVQNSIWPDVLKGAEEPHCWSEGAWSDLEVAFF